jgi:SSS family solute:Na+ symporter
MTLHWIDLIIVLGYLLGITGIGVLSSPRQRESSSAYFLAGRSLRWPSIGLALFATNISTVHLIGLASSGFSDGIVIGNFEWMAPLLLIVLGLVFAPFYFRNRVATLPEYLEGRYGPAPRTFLAFMAVVGALFIHIGVTLYAGAVVFQSFVPVDIFWSILVVSLLTAVYTVLGGLKAVVITESIQAVLLLAGALAVTIFGFMALGDAGIGSLDGVREAAKPDQMRMIRTDGEFAWWIMLLGYPVIGLWYWCSDQTIVQRVLGARTERGAQMGPLFCGFIKILPVVVMVFPGVMGYVLFRDQIGKNPDTTLIVLIKNLLPVGLQGLVIAGLLAALMSTVAGALNSTATLVSIDIFRRLRPRTPDRTLVRIGQAAAVVVMVAATIWSMFGEQFGGIFKGINAMIAVLAPPISTVFIWGIFWRRGTKEAALVTLVSGFVLGAVAFVLDFPAFGLKWFTQSGIPFMLQAFLLFAACSILFVAVSLCTPPPSAEQVDRYSWPSPLAVIKEKPWSGLLDPRGLAILLLLVLGACYWILG